MKKQMIFLLLILPAITLIAQKNQIKLGGGIGGTPYESTAGWNVEFQYEYNITSTFSGFISVGRTGDEFTTQGRSRGTDGMDSWDNSWAFNYSERFNYFDVGLKYKLFKVGERFETKATIGGSLGQSIYNYPENIFINRGIIEQDEEVTRKVEFGMFLIGIDNYVYLTERFFLNLNLHFRTLFKEKYIVNREINFNNNLAFTTSGILNVTTLNLQFGYLF